jgi:hypothetical protein
MATCNHPLGKGALNFLCELPPGHEGPHKAQGNDRSLRERAAWEDAQAVLRQSQGKPLTMSDRTEGGETGTPPPGFFPCRYHQVIHHQDVRSPKCMAWSGPHDGPQPRNIQRLPSTMGSATVFEQLPDMPDDPESQAMVFKQEGTEFVQQPTDAVADQRIEELHGPGAEVSGPGTDPDTGPGTEAESWTPGEVGDLLEPHHEAAEAAARFAPTRSVPRSGEQGLPTRNDYPSAQDALIAAIETRKAIGLERYGTLLQPFNKRDSFTDLLDEAVDGAVYAMAVEMERQEMRAEMALIHEEVAHEFGTRAEITQKAKRILDWLSGV